MTPLKLRKGFFWIILLDLCCFSYELTIKVKQGFCTQISECEAF